jgi:hypothetical protein
MYCEDVDLSYRISKSGHHNIYFPEATLIHYKGESTRKATLSYVRIFNEALSTFVRKHYSRQNARLFVAILNVGIALRAVLAVLKNILKGLRMPLFDALVLLVTLWFLKEFWVGTVKNIHPISLRMVALTFPAYVLTWLGALYLNGAYDQPYRAMRVVRGMLIGTVLALAYFGMLPAELRYSRAIILFGGLTGTVALLGLHELLHRLGIFRFIPYEALPKKAVIAGDLHSFHETAQVLRQVHYAPQVVGRLATDAARAEALASLDGARELLFTLDIDEVIFCVNGLRYETILNQMQRCGAGYEYKIHLPGSQSFVGSNSSHTAGDLYTLDQRYNLSGFAQQRNKRVLDVVLSFGFVLMWPVLFWRVQEPWGWLRNCFQVLVGSRTWIGYARNGNDLPPLRPAVLPTYHLLPGYEPAPAVLELLDRNYAREYTPGTDLGLVLKNFRFLGKK